MRAFRLMERAISQMQQEKDDPEYRSRTSRLEKWKECVKLAQQALQVPVAPREKDLCTFTNIFLSWYFLCYALAYFCLYA